MGRLDDMDLPHLDLHLYSSSLLSKWGFQDGDILYDYTIPPGINRKEFLCFIVEMELIPKLHQNVEVVRIGTSHNPIRAESVDGANVEKWWYLSDLYGAPKLTPECVVVTEARLRELLANYQSKEN